MTVVAERGVTVDEAARLLAHWGFLARPDLPDREGPASLLVALRPSPTLRHYDPELIEYWTSQGGRGVRRTLSRATAMPLATAYSWGEIRIVDRLQVTNEYLTFGGSLRADRVDDAVIAVFTSPAPLLRRGGHSQGWDPGADSLGAHFGRFLAAVDCVPGFEAVAARADPVTRYAAFLVDTTTRYCTAAALPRPQDELLMLLRGEVRRLQQSDGEAWLRGIALWQQIDAATRRPVPDSTIELWRRAPAVPASSPLGAARGRRRRDAASDDAPRRTGEGEPA